MYAAVEHGPVLCSDSNILCLSWKGRVPKSEKEKPVCRRRYYEEGWLATGNGRGVVGVTFTSSHCRRDRSTPQRINFNLRGHNSEVGCGIVSFFLWSLLVIFLSLLPGPKLYFSFLDLVVVRLDTVNSLSCMPPRKIAAKVGIVHRVLTFHKEDTCPLLLCFPPHSWELLLLPLWEVQLFGRHTVGFWLGWKNQTRWS